MMTPLEFGQCRIELIIDGRVVVNKRIKRREFDRERKLLGKIAERKYVDYYQIYMHLPSKVSSNVKWQFSKEQVAAIVDKANRGVSKKALCEEYKVPYYRITDIFHEHGLKTRILHTNRKYTEEQTERKMFKASKLTRQDVLDIREAYANGVAKDKLKLKYKINRWSLNGIISGRTFKSVA